MSNEPTRGLDLGTLHPKGHLKWRLMFDGNRKGLTLMGLACVVIGIAVAIAAVGILLRETTFEREAVTTAATVERKGVHKPGEVEYYMVKYSFTDRDGRRVVGKGDLIKEAWDAIDKGDTIDIEYLPGSPGMNRPVQRPHERSGTFLALLPLPVLFLLGGEALLVWAMLRAAGQAHLLSNGLLTTGMVDKTEERKDLKTPAGFPITVSYHFELPDGTVQKAEELVTDLTFAATLQPGEPVGVVYLPTEPAQCALFLEQWKKYYVNG